MKIFTNILFAIFISFLCATTSFAELEYLDTTETEQKKKTVKRLLGFMKKISLATMEFGHDVAYGAEDDEYQYPESTHEIIKSSVSALKREIVVIQAIMKNRTYDTWPEDNKSINTISKRLKRILKKLALIRKNHNESHEIEE